MTDDVKRGISCFECGEITDDAEEGEECGACGDDNAEPVEITPCPVSAGTTGSGKACPDENHHWGRGDHVRSVDGG